MLTLSTTAYGHASNCLKRYQYSQVEKLVPRPKDVAPRMRKGIWAHRCLQEHHAGHDWRKALVELHDWVVARGVTDEAALEMGTDVRELIEQYISYWDGKPGQRWTGIVSEQEFTYNVSDTVQLKATVDLIVEDHRGMWLVEHKTTSDIPDSIWRGIDPQTAMQLFLVSRDPQFKDVRGIIFNYLLSTRPPIPEVTQKGLFSKSKCTTTSVAFDKAKALIVQNWMSDKGNFGDMSKYLAEERARMVNDSLWFQRYDVYKPDDNVVETMRDIAATVWAIRDAGKRNHWRRSFHIISCRRFCTYSELCSQEYFHGKPSMALREGLFTKDTGEREGR